MRKISVMKHLLPLTLIIILFSSCINPDNSEKHEHKNQTKFYSVNKGIDLLVSPSESSQKLVNEKASSITKDTEYCKLDNSNKLIVVDIKGSWSKVKVIEPEWLQSVLPKSQTAVPVFPYPVFRNRKH